MHLEPALIDAMFARHGVSGAWEPLPTTGVANRIFATADVVLRVATDHPDAVVDARTESVAAPVARAAGVLTPRMIAFDDTRTLVDRPFSLWERVNGETLGLASLPPRAIADVWHQVGRELAKLHDRVRECADPSGYLDQPARDQDVDAALTRLVAARTVGDDVADRIAALANELRAFAAERFDPRFIHDDVHPMNIMCSKSGELVALLDWGDAGWGDPALDFAAMPFDAIGPALQGYAAEAAGSIGAIAELRVAWYKLLDAVDDLESGRGRALNLDAFDRMVRKGIHGSQ